MRNEKTLSENLIEVGYVCTETYFDHIKRMIAFASEADKAVQDIDPREIKIIKKADTFERLKRNTLALVNLLEMARAASESIKIEVHELFEAKDIADKEFIEHRRALLLSQKKKEYNEKYRKADREPDK